MGDARFLGIHPFGLFKAAHFGSEMGWARAVIAIDVTSVPDAMYERLAVGKYVGDDLRPVQRTSEVFHLKEICLRAIRYERYLS